MKRSKLALFGGTPVRKNGFRPHPVLNASEKKEALSVLKTGLLSGFIASSGPAFLGGPKVKTLESLIARYFKMPHVVCMNSATAGLHAALSAGGMGPKDEVIVTPYTMSASAAAILMQNAVPIFADIDEKTFCINPEKIREKITSRTKAIVVVHLFGQPAPIEEILKIAKTHNLFVVEDCAQAPAAKVKGKFVGTFGDIGVFSLNQHKTITTGEGGWAMTKNKRLALRMQLVRNHGEVVVDHLKSDVEAGPVLGWNYRMTELEAAIGIAQFKNLNKLTRHRVRLADYLIKGLAEIPGITTPFLGAGSTHVYFLLPLKYDERKTGLSREVFVKAVTAEGIPFAAGYVRPIYWDSLYQNKKMYLNSSFPFDENVRYQRGDCPVAERMHSKELVTTNLCRYPLSIRDMQDVLGAVKKVLDSSEEILKRLKQEKTK